MNKLYYVCFVFALVLGISMGAVNRHRRQTTDDSSDNSLEDKYGWAQNSFPGSQRPRPNQQWNQGNQWQNQGQQNQNWQRPNQGQDWQQPNQGQDWQQPNQSGQDWQQPNQGGQDWQQPNQGSTQNPNGNSSTTTTQSPAVAACIRNCPTTPEYNPVCGTDGVTYDNAGRLSCAQQCGVNVSLLREARCPATTPAPAPST